MFGIVFAILFNLVVVLVPCGIALSAQVKITAGYGGELGYQAPIWVAHELKLFAKHGMTSELILLKNPPFILREPQDERKSD